jgi:hypothetical protein
MSYRADKSKFTKLCSDGYRILREYPTDFDGIEDVKVPVFDPKVVAKLKEAAEFILREYV